MKAIEILIYPVEEYFIPSPFLVDQVIIWYKDGRTKPTRTYQIIIDLMLAGF